MRSTRKANSRRCPRNRTVPAATCPPERRTVEDWATAKGMYPQIFAGRDVSVQGGGTVDERTGLVGGSVRISDFAAGARRNNPSFWKFAAARAHNQWPIGLTMTEAEFDTAIVAATDGITLR